MTGRAAISGFASQALMALVRALGRSDWDTMEVDPERPGEVKALEKVDIEFKTNGALLLHVQVKRKEDEPFTAGVAAGWAKDLADSSKATEKELILVGRGYADAAAHGVKIGVLPGSEEDVYAICASRIAQLLESHHLARPDTATMDRLVEDVWAKVFLGSRAERVWSRSDLLNLFVTGAYPVPTQPTMLRVHLHRVVIPRHDADDAEVDDYIAWEFHNPLAEPVALLTWKIELQDVGDCELVAYGDGLPDYPSLTRVAGSTTNSKFEVILPVREALQPGERRFIGAHVRRYICISSDGPLRTYRDPVLGGADRQTCDVTVVFPCRGKFNEASGLEVGECFVRWLATVEAAQRTLSATMVKSNHGPNPDEHRAAEDRAFGIIRRVLGHS